MKTNSQKGLLFAAMLLGAAAAGGCSGARDDAGNDPTSEDSADALGGQGVTPLASIRGYENVSFAPSGEGFLYIKSNSDPFEGGGAYQLIAREPSPGESRTLSESSTASGSSLAVSPDGQYVVWRETESVAGRPRDLIVVGNGFEGGASALTVDHLRVGGIFRFESGRVFGIAYQDGNAGLTPATYAVISFDPADSSTTIASIPIECPSEQAPIDFDVLAGDVYVTCGRVATGDASRSTLLRFPPPDGSGVSEAETLARVNGTISALAKAGSTLLFATTVHADLPEGPSGEPEAAPATLWQVTAGADPEALVQLPGVGLPLQQEDFLEEWHSIEAFGVARMAASETEVYVSRGREVLAVNLATKESRVVTDLQPAPNRKVWIDELHFGGGKLYAIASERESGNFPSPPGGRDVTHIVQIATGEAAN